MNSLDWTPQTLNDIADSVIRVIDDIRATNVKIEISQEEKYQIAIIEKLFRN